MRPRQPATTTRTSPWLVAACAIALLHVGREFLAPLALAAVLSLVIAPLKRRLARLGLGHAGGALASVFLVAAALACMAAVLGSQLAAVATDLPQYREAIRAKLERVRDLTIAPLEQFGTELGGVLPRPAVVAGRRPARAPSAQAAPEAPVQPASTATDTARRLLAHVWGPVGEAGIVLVLLVFILLEHEGLRDRILRLVGEADAGRTMQALDDAAQGVSRFFFAQAVVNATFGIVLACLLWLVGIPHAALWGALGGVLRFVPYVGALCAGAVIAAFAAAVDPGWSAMWWSVALVASLELVVANAVEPRVYGHSSGLSPLAVIVSALFWSVLWGPLGLLLSTPVTLCLVVVGRHVRALEPFTVLLGDPTGLAAGLRLYQRVLSADAGEIVASARVYLRRSNFARYCDQVVLPGLALAAADLRAGRIGHEQHDRIRRTIAAVTQSLEAATPQDGASRRRRSLSLLEANVGAHLHAARTPRGASAGAAPAITLCTGAGTPRDDVLALLLAHALRDEGVDAHALAAAEIHALSRGPGEPEVATVFVVAPLAEDLLPWIGSVRELRASLGRAVLLAVRLPLEDGAADEALVGAQVDLVVRSYSEAVAFALAGRTEAA